MGIVYGKVFLKDLKVGLWTKILIRTLHVFCLFFPIWHGLKDLFILHKLDGKPLSTLAVKTGEVTGGRRDVDQHGRLGAVREQMREHN